MNLQGYSRVLVVEDEAVVRHFLSNALRSLGFRSIREAPDGKQGFSILTTAPVDFIVCDWHMPVMDGMALLRQVRGNPLWNLIPFVLLTADTDPAAASEAIEEGADAFIFKPIHLENLEKCVQSVIDRRSALSGVWISLARAGGLADAGMHEEARAELEQAKARCAGKAFGWVEAGKVEEEMGDGEAAERSYRRALEIDPRFPRAYDRLFQLFTRQERLDEARVALREALRFRESPERHRAMARLCMAAGDEEGARESLRRAVASFRSAGARHSAAAEFFLEHGRSDLATQEFASALDADPSNLHYFNRLGISLRREQRYAEAVANYLRAIKLAPTDPVLYYNLARAYLGLGQRAQAEAALKRALLAEPNFEEAAALLKKLAEERCAQETG